MVEVRGYPIGPVVAGGAFTADFALPGVVDSQTLANILESDRRLMDVRPGMRNKYTPLRFDPATGAQLMGGRYLFDTYANALDYERWTTEEFSPEPGSRFWDRFGGVEKHTWKVAGAHDYKPMAEAHHVVRFERYICSPANLDDHLGSAWPILQKEADRRDLSSLWLLFKPQADLVGVLSVAAKASSDDPAVAASLGLTALESMPALGDLLPDELGAQQVFDRTSVNFNSWLPESRASGGAHATFEVSPPHAIPGA